MTDSEAEFPGMVIWGENANISWIEYKEVNLRTCFDRQTIKSQLTSLPNIKSAKPRDAKQDGFFYPHLTLMKGSYYL